MTKTKRIVIAGLCVALGVVLPVAVHSIPNAGNILLPMHIPVLLCGLICGPWYGLACGILA
ncbi:MAG: ECF transporter S component, partial [Clostridia bacterium]|nr:ECF transporter S component [Clostridia bacterium]